jgi:hypothetical protein
VRAFSDEQLAQMLREADDELKTRLISELRTQYQSEDRISQTVGALYTMLQGVHQRLVSEVRSVEGMLRMLMPPPPAQQSEPERKRPRMMMDDQPG